MRIEHFAPFGYLAEASIKLVKDDDGPIGYLNDPKPFWNTASSDQQRLILDSAREIERRNDGKRLADWVIGYEADKRVRNAKRKVSLLLDLFERLGEAEVEGFRQGAYSVEKEWVNDWSKVPLNLAFLVEDAKKYGECWIEESAEAALKEMSAEERDRLAALHETLERNADLEHFLAKYPPGNEHPESQDIDGLLSIAHAAWLDKRGQSLFSP